MVAENKKRAEFLSDILEVFKRHNIAISHEDKHGGFELVRLDQEHIDWMSDARVRFSMDALQAAA